MQIDVIKDKIKNYPVVFLLALALSVRLYNLTSPIIGAHSWRQSDTAAMSRNFYTNGLNLFSPQVDWGGLPGYCETEFPIYSYIVALLYKIFGVHDFLGRLFSVVCFLTAIYFLYRLVVNYFDSNVAFWSCLVYSILPLNIYYSRTFQPESMLLMCCIIGVYYFSIWLDSEQHQDLILSCVFVSLACLIKVLPIIYLGLPIFYLAWSKFGIKLFSMRSLWIYSIFIIGSVFAWYYHAHNIFLEYGNTFGFSAESTDRYDYSVLLKLWFWTELIFRTVLRHFAIFCFPLFISGLLIPRKNAREYVFDVWLVAVALTWILVPVTSIIHEYYQLPFMIPAVVLVGKACNRYFGKRKKAIVTCFCLALITGSLIYSLDYMQIEKTDKSAVFQLAQQVKSITPKNELIISSTGGDPTLLYLTDHRGWLVNPKDLTTDFIASKKKLGATYLVGSFNLIESYNKKVDDNQKQKINHILSKYPNLAKDGGIFIAKLDGQK
jgi:4-amino-4-deoxy-L-arabinose transferase-like glycosyltransferase